MCCRENLSASMMSSFIIKTQIICNISVKNSIKYCNMAIWTKFLSYIKSKFQHYIKTSGLIPTGPKRSLSWKSPTTFTFEHSHTGGPTIQWRGQSATPTVSPSDRGRPKVLKRRPTMNTSPYSKEGWNGLIMLSPLGLHLTSCWMPSLKNKLCHKISNAFQESFTLQGSSGLWGGLDREDQRISIMCRIGCKHLGYI